MIIEIDHGLPQSKFFLIIQPRKQYDEPKIPETGSRNIVELKDINTGQVTKAELCGICSISEYDFMNMEIFSRLAYGCSPVFLKKQLIKRYPELEKEFAAEYWLLKLI
jgi:hypothetical protein